jgi:hypothetical protein
MQTLQLKITIKSSRPPIWRRVLVRADCTFWDLHSVIQDLFGWEDCHLHDFEQVTKRGEEQHTFELYDEDEPIVNPLGRPLGHYHDEYTEKLSKWITAEHPRFLYTYDFGDTWEHEILLEKEVELPKLELARYLDGGRRGLEEDSKLEAILDCAYIIESADDVDKSRWHDLVAEYGESRMTRLLGRARKEAASQAPKRVRFSDPVERYKYYGS